MGFMVKHASVHDPRTLAVVNTIRSSDLNWSADGDDVRQELQFRRPERRLARSVERIVRVCFHQLHQLHQMVIQLFHEARNHDFS
jgi:hypothetical protein